MTQPSFSKSFSTILAGNIGAAAIGALTILISIRSLPPDQWAPVAAIIGLGPALGLVLSLGSVGYHTRTLARLTSADERTREYARFVARRATLSGFVTLVGVSLLLLIATPSLGLIAILAGARFFRGGTSVLMASEKRFGGIALLAVTEKCVCLIFVVITQAAGLVSTNTLPLAFLLSYVAYASVALARERPDLSWTVLKIGACSPFAIWKGSARFGVQTLTGPLQQADVSVLTFVAGAYEAGLLGAGSRLTSATNVVGSALASVIMPYFAPTDAKLPKRVKGGRFTIFLIALGGAAILAMAVTTPIWVPAVLGSAYAQADRVVTCYLLLAVVTMALQPMMVLLQAWDREALVMRYSIIQGIAALLAIGIFGFLFGALGAAVSQLCVYTAIAVSIGAHCHRIWKFKTTE